MGSLFRRVQGPRSLGLISDMTYLTYLCSTSSAMVIGSGSQSRASGASWMTWRRRPAT
uniref:Uncharacterized protein n=2 Tax=Human herpesvirus 2 TaxID=10310 RepID=A0A481TI10_HHV2|nr:hypothetical protein [Human alphaherpesvirus 2]